MIAVLLGLGLLYACYRGVRLCLRLLWSDPTDDVTDRIAHIHHDATHPLEKW